MPENKITLCQFSRFFASISILAAGSLGCTHSQPKPTLPQEANPVSGLIHYDYKPGELTQLCKAALQATEQRLNEIPKVASDARTMDNTLLPFETITADFSDVTTPLTFMGYVSTNEKIHDEGSACEDEVNKFIVRVTTRKDLYEAIKAAKPRNKDETRLLSETLLVFEKNGLKLSDDKLAQVKELLQRLSTLQTQFSDNLNKDNTTVTFDAKELAGVSNDFLKRLKKTVDDKYIVNTKSTDYLAVAENASNSETRHKMLLAYENKATDKNTKLLEEAIVLRQQIATFIGYKTWADYQTDGRMAKDAQTVSTFLSELRSGVKQRFLRDMSKLMAFKKQIDPASKVLEPWDLRYLAYQLKKKNYSLDEEKVREYFPADLVIKGMFEVYSQILGVKFTEIQDAKTWSPDVKFYQINDGKSGDLIAYFYTDFFPRPGKYGHAAAFPLISGRTVSAGYSKPVSAIVANFNPPAGDKPSLLNHDEVETIFHEFGHIMHQTLTRAPYASLSGSNTVQDFVEAPSQMLENWVWSPEVLGKLSGYYQDHSKKLPAAMLKKMIQARDFNRGYFYMRQLLFGILDMGYHTHSGPVDVTKTYQQLFNELIGLRPLEGGHFPASFGHLMGGYSAGYYGYVWSEVFAADMFTRFEKSGLLNPEIGADYRHIILEKGKMEPAEVLLKEFLGREPNRQAFYKKLGIKAKRSR